MAPGNAVYYEMPREHYILMAEKSAGSFFGIETAQEKVTVCQRVKCGRAGMLSGPGFNLICQSLRCFA